MSCFNYGEFAIVKTNMEYILLAGFAGRTVNNQALSPAGAGARAAPAEKL